MRYLVLFDVDGTLLWTRGAGRAAIRQALLAEIGATGPIDDYRFDGKTDHQIVRDLSESAGVPIRDAAQLDELFHRYLALLESELERNVQVEVLPGVGELLDAVHERDDAVLGLLTGNIAGGARLKLQAAGLDPGRFVVGAYGSDAEQRPQLPAIAVERAATIMGRTPQGAEVIILGDTPADMRCGSTIGARVIGVCTGSYDANALTEAGAHAVFEDFSDTHAVLGAILT